MEQTSDTNKDVEDGMEPLFVVADAVERGADGVGNSAEEKEHRTAEAESDDGGLDVHQDAPSHTEVADHRKELILFQVYGIEHDTECGKSPDDTEYHPTHRGIYASQGHEGVGGVCTGDQDEYRAMIDYLQHLFCVKAVRKAVIDAGYSIEHDHRGTENRAGYHAPNALVPGGHDNAEHRCDDADGAADDVSGHIEYFLRMRIVGKLSLD